jgi:nucleotide-binding universal stress UspA family protein
LHYDPLKIKDIVVPVDGSHPSLDALALACGLAKRTKATVYAVYVIEVARTMPLDAEMDEQARRGETVLQEAEKYADELDYQISGELLQARDAGHAIVDEAAERAVSAIIMGVSYTTGTAGEFELNGDAQYVLKNAPCQVILVRSLPEGAQ